MLLGALLVESDSLSFNNSAQSKIEIKSLPREQLSDSCKIIEDVFVQFFCQKAPKEMKKMCVTQTAGQDQTYLSCVTMNPKSKCIYYVKAKILKTVIQKCSKLKDGQNIRK